MTVFDTEGRQELDELLAGWPRLKTDPEICHLLSVSLEGPDEVSRSCTAWPEQVRAGTRALRADTRQRHVALLRGFFQRQAS